MPHEALQRIAHAGRRSRARHLPTRLRGRVFAGGGEVVSDYIGPAFEQLASFIAAVGKGFESDGDRLMHIAWAQNAVAVLRNEMTTEHPAQEALAWNAGAEHARRDSTLTDAVVKAAKEHAANVHDIDAEARLLLALQELDRHRRLPDPDYDACPTCEGRGFIFAPVNSGTVPCPECKS